MICITLFSSAMVNAGAGTKTASNSQSVHDKSSSWINQEATRGDVKAYATFKNGLCTAWFDLAWQTEDRSCTATAKA